MEDAVRALLELRQPLLVRGGLRVDETRVYDERGEQQYPGDGQPAGRTRFTSAHRGLELQWRIRREVAREPGVERRGSDLPRFVRQRERVRHEPDAGHTGSREVFSHCRDERARGYRHRVAIVRFGSHVEQQILDVVGEMIFERIGDGAVEQSPVANFHLNVREQNVRGAEQHRHETGIRECRRGALCRTRLRLAAGGLEPAIPGHGDAAAEYKNGFSH